MSDEETEQIETLAKEISESSKKLDANLKAINDTKLEHEALQAQTADFEKRRDIAKSTADMQEERLASNDDTLQQQTSDIIRNRIENTQLEKSNSVLREENRIFVEGRAEREDTERARVTALIESEMAEAERDLKDTKKDLAELLKDVASATKKLAKLTDDIDAATTAKADAITERDSVQTGLNRDRRTLAEVISQKQKLGEEVTTLTSNKTELDATIASLEKDIQDKTDSITAINAEISATNDALIAKKDELSAVESRIFALTAREQTLNQREAFIIEKFKQAGVPYR